MKLADSYLYYPFIQIPTSTLIHSLLFKDNIKRIIPPHHEMDRNIASEAAKQNDICRQYLGYEFIKEADYWKAKEVIAPLFCDFLEEINSTDNPEQFFPILGENYQHNFNIKNRTIVSGTQYIVYAKKLSEQVFEKLNSLGWLKYHKDKYACEMSQELSNLYMTLLATCISQQTKEEISTSSRLSDEIVNSDIFRSSFRDILPQHSEKNDNIHNICINMLLNTNKPKQPIDTTLTFPEAVRVRAGLESERKDFCAVVDDLTNKIKDLDLKDPEAFISLDVKNIIEGADQYMSQIHSEARRQVTSARKNNIANIQTGLSLVLPSIGLLGDAYFHNGALPGMWGGTFLALTMSTYFLPKLRAEEEEKKTTNNAIVSSRENAYLYMNRLWDIQASKDIKV